MRPLSDFEDIVKRVADGSTLSDACTATGIDPGLLYSRLRKDPTLRHLYANAVAASVERKFGCASHTFSPSTVPSVQEVV